MNISKLTCVLTLAVIAFSTTSLAAVPPDAHNYCGIHFKGEKTCFAIRNIGTVRLNLTAGKEDADFDWQNDPLLADWDDVYQDQQLDLASTRLTVTNDTTKKIIFQDPNWKNKVFVACTETSCTEYAPPTK